MNFINHTEPKLLIADAGKHIRAINDVYEAEHYNEDGILIPEHFPYYSTVLLLGIQTTSLEQCEELYVEEEI